MGVTPQIGLPIEVAVWLTGRETAYQMEQWKRDCEAEIGRFGMENGVIMTAGVYTEKRPGEDRVPPVPDHIAGPDVRLLICEARVAELLKPEIIKSTGFVHDLDERDLARLRRITRRAYAKTKPGQAALSDAECDAIIERVGPESALKTLRGGVDSKAIH
jgi:hypothetical protein